MACALSESEMRERRKAALDAVGGVVVSVTPLPLGYAYRFEPTSQVLTFLAQWVDLERQCCPFLIFRIVVEADRQPICLEITGTTEAKPLIANYFGL